MKTAALTFGRFNPPSIGHEALVQTLNSQPADDHLLYASHSQDAKKNPLSYEEKLQFLDELFGIEYPRLSIVQSPARTVIEVLQELTGEYDHIILVVGSDRINDFRKLVNAYNGRPDKAGNILYSFASIEVVSAGDRDPDADGVEGMSASKLRALAVEGDFQAFAKGVPTDNTAVARELYAAVRKGMKLEEHRYREAAEDDVFAELLTKTFPSVKADSPQAKALASEFADMKKFQPKLTAKSFFELKVKQQEEIKAFAEEDLQKKKQAVGYFQKLASSLPSDGGLSVRPPKPGSTVRLLLTRSEPPTTQHSRAIATLLNVKISTPTAFAVGILQATVDAKVSGDAAIRTLWTRDLAIPAGKPIYLLYGTAEQIARTLARYFAKLNYTAQPELLGKASPYVLKGWNSVKNVAVSADPNARATRSAAAFTLAGGGFIDSPNLASQALEEASRDTAEIKDLKGIKDKQTTLYRAFAAQLASGGPKQADENYKLNLYHAFCEMYKMKTGRDVEGNLGAAIKSLLGAEIEAAKQAGEILGITQVAKGVSSAKQALKGKTPSEEAPSKN